MITTEVTEIMMMATPRCTTNKMAVIPSVQATSIIPTNENAITSTMKFIPTVKLASSDFVEELHFSLIYGRVFKLGLSMMRNWDAVFITDLINMLIGSWRM